MSNLGIDYLNGKHVITTEINSSNDLLILHTNDGPIYLKWYGDCCAHCFLANVSGASFLEDTSILEARNTEWMIISEDRQYGDVMESMGTTLKTNKGYVNLDSRVEHNGYYAGYVEVYTELPYSNEITTLRKLEDF